MYVGTLAPYTGMHYMTTSKDINIFEKRAFIPCNMQLQLLMYKLSH